MTTRPLLLAVLVLASAAAALTGSQPWSGPVLWSLTPEHGLHATDPLVAGLALLSVLLLVRQDRSGPRPARRPRLAAA